MSCNVGYMITSHEPRGTSHGRQLPPKSPEAATTAAVGVVTLLSAMVTIVGPLYGKFPGTIQLKPPDLRHRGKVVLWRCKL